MESLFQPTHLIFILIIVLILFGPGKLPDTGKRLGRAWLGWRGQWSNLRGALFMAKGVDPSVGRDVGDMLPDEDTNRSSTWFLCLLAILFGNTLYFIFAPFLPAAAQMGEGSSPGMPALVDLWFCIFVFGVLSLPALLRRRNKPKN
jgi:TatA/E family protein of Tat protein translocase